MKKRTRFCHNEACRNDPSFYLWLLADGSDARHSCGMHLASGVRAVQGEREPSIYHVYVKTIR